MHIRDRKKSNRRLCSDFFMLSFNCFKFCKSYFFKCFTYLRCITFPELHAYSVFSNLPRSINFPQYSFLFLKKSKETLQRIIN